MFDADLFSDIHNVSPGGPDPDPSAPRRRICRLCASEVMLYGLREWWIEERRKGFLEGPMVERKDCADGRDCRRQQDLGPSFRLCVLFFTKILFPLLQPTLENVCLFFISLF